MEDENKLLAVKAVGDWEIEVRAVPFGADGDNQTFDADTDYMLGDFPTPAIIYHHGVKQGRTGFEDVPIVIGKTVSAEKRTDGIWLRVVLDKLNEYAQKVWEAAKAGLAVASSDSIAHLARLDIGGKRIPYEKRPGRIAVWPLAAVSLWDAGSGQLTPASPNALAMPALKTIYEQAGLTLPDISGEDEPQAETEAEMQVTAAKSGTDDEPTIGDKKMDEKEKGLSAEEAQALIDAALKAQAEQNEKAKKAVEEQEALIAAEVEKRVEAVTAEAAKARRLPIGEGAPYQAQFSDTWKYDNLSPGEIALVIDTLKISGRGQASPAAFKALALRVADEKVEQNERELSAGYVKGAFKASTGIDPTVDAIKAVTDPMYSSGSGHIGEDWVGTAYSRELWRKIRSENNLVSKFPSVTIPDGYSSEYFPLDSTDPTWYKVAESSANNASIAVPEVTVTSSQATTAQKQITVAKMGARLLYSGEMTEDSLVAFVPQMREQLQISGQEAMEHVLIDGDTSADATNINDTVGGAAGTEVFTILDGLRHLAIITNTDNKRAGGALDEDDFLDTMWLMGTAGLAGADLAKCAFIIDPNVYKASLKLASLKTKDVWAQATLESGVLTKMWGYPIFPSWNMHKLSADRKTNADGEVDIDVTTNNVYGAILGVRFDQWKVAYKRRMTMEVTRFANADAWEIVCLARWGLAYRDTEAAAITYGLTV